MSIIRNILVRVGADINPLQKSMDKANSVMQGFNNDQKKALYSIQANLKKVMGSSQSSSSAISGAMSLAGSALVSLGVAAAAAFAVVSGKAIKAAMTTVESENLFSVSMGNMAGAARDWSNQLQESLGLNAYQVRENVGLFYNMTTSMGLAKDQAYQVSTGLTKLAYDMSSFYNQDASLMFEKLQSGLSGEVEPLKRLGIIVNETTTQIYAYTHGIAKQGATLTEQQKVMARYGAIMEQTKNAQGDLARTITSPANQWRLFQTQIQLATINLGNAFMPIVERVLPILTNMAKGLVTVTNTVAQFMRALFGGNSAQTQNAQSAADAAAAQTKLGNATAAAGAKAKKGVAGFDEINQLQEAMASSAADATGVTAMTPTPAKQEDQNFLPKGILEFANKVKDALAPIGKYFAELGDVFRNFWIGVKPYLQPIIDFLVNTLKPVWTNIWEGVKNLFINVFNTIKGVLSGALDVIKGIIMVFSGIITGNWTLVWEGLKTIVFGAWEAIKSVIVGALNIIFSTNKITWDSIVNALSTAWSWVSTNVSIVFDAVKNAITKVWNTISSTTSTVWNAVWGKLKEVWNWISTNVSLIFNNARDAISNAFGAVGKTIQNIWDGIVATIKGAINVVLSFINFFIKKLNNIKIVIPQVDIPLVGKVGGLTLGLPPIPEIPYLAKGGIVASPTLAMIGEQGREAVVPLENTSFVDTIASAIGSAVLNAMQFAQPQQAASGKSGDIIIQIDSDKLARVMLPAIEREKARTGNPAMFIGNMPLAMGV